MSSHLPPYAHILKSLEVHRYPGFVDINNNAKTLEAYIQVIEMFVGRQSGLVVVPYLPRMFGNMLGMLAELPPVDIQDRPTVHRRRCIAIGHMLQNISLQTHAAAQSKGLQQLPSTSWGGCAPTSKT